jgi:hypothetical protein
MPALRLSLLLLFIALGGALLDVRRYGPEDALLHVAIVCGQHPREAFARDVCTQWAIAWALDPPVRLRITLVPNANPDGTAVWWANESMACWRGNGRGVDLNRNWPVPPACASVPVRADRRVLEPEWFSGSAPFSEWETRELAALLEDDIPDVLLSIHSGARLLVTPYDACDVSPKNLPRAMQLARWLRTDICDDCAVGVSSRMMYSSRGTLTDWAHGVLGVPFVYTWEVWEPADGDVADCRAAFSPPLDTPRGQNELQRWTQLARRLSDMDVYTWTMLLRWVGIVDESGY